ncbi:MAG TPA: GAF domain-containing protein [Candidatus Latescibacteria bacterium]|nr:GAF domain-containing protein [Candidatus Handelsmanbacteria bacterium]HIL11762.1 GAF domain-containing protein [Candidatus Latescibacterota bacterium]
MNQAISPIEEKDEVDLTRWIQTTALRMESDAGFSELFLQVVDRIKAAGLQIYALSIYLLMAESKSDALHYTAFHGEASWFQDQLHEGMAEFQVQVTKEAQSWLGAQSGTVVAYLCVPTSTGAMTIAAERAEPFSDEQQALLQTLVPALEMLVVRHRDLAAYAVINEAYLQTSSRLINSNPDLMALQDGSFDLSAESVDEVAQNILEFISQRLGLDRGGIFLRHGDILRGFWGMDDEGAIIAIPNTIFQLYPTNNKELTHTALIARGEKQYYLTQNLGAEVGGAIADDYGANIAVPMRVGERIIGVLAGDNFISKQPISYDQVQALMVLANQGAAMIEMVKLYQDLQKVSDELERRVSERTAFLAQTNDQLQEEIAERRRAEQALQVSLDEKNMLFREVHHRVKNNLQTISSLLSLQTDLLEDPQALSALESSRSRVEAMGRIHQQLYQTQDWAKVEFDVFLRVLVEDLLDTYRLGTVELIIDTESVYFDVDQSIHCCLLINELVTNALKHAFPDGGAGTLRVGLRPRADGLVVLEIADDGVGFPAGLNFRETESMGLQIAISLVKNLQGQIELHRENGTLFQIVFSPQSS